MKKLCSLFLVSILVISAMIFPGCQNASSEVSSPTESETQNESLKNESLTDILDNTVDDCGFIGTVCIYYNGKKKYECNRGFADKDNNIQNSPDLIYRIGSLSKQFAAAGICILKDEGKLDFDDTVSKYFPNSKFGDKVAIRNLLNMTSGIPDFFSDFNQNKTYTQDEIQIDVSENNTSQKNRELIESWILSQSLIFEPGTKFYYCNSNYALLGRIIEKVSGKSYEDFITERIFVPLKMTSTSFDFNNLNTKGYLKDFTFKSVKTEDQFLKHEYYEWTLYPGVCTAFADICSSVEDLHRWLTALRNGEVVKPGTYEAMIESNGSGDGFGYGFGFLTNDEICWHTGALGSYQSEIVFRKDKDFSIIIMTNTFKDGFYKNIGIKLYNAIGSNKELADRLAED